MASNSGRKRQRRADAIGAIVEEVMGQASDATTRSIGDQVWLGLVGLGYDLVPQRGTKAEDIEGVD